MAPLLQLLKLKRNKDRDEARGVPAAPDDSLYKFGRLALVEAFSWKTTALGDGYERC